MHAAGHLGYEGLIQPEMPDLDVTCFSKESIARIGGMDTAGWTLDDW